MTFITYIVFKKVPLKLKRSQKINTDMSTDNRPTAGKQLIALSLEEFTLRNNHDDNITYFAKCSYIPAAVAAYSFTVAGKGRMKMKNEGGTVVVHVVIGPDLFTAATDLRIKNARTEIARH